MAGFFCVFVNAQRGQGAAPEVNITGQVIDKETNEPLEYATVSFFSKRQNKIVTGGITDIKGNFNIPVPMGMYDISIEYISFKTQKITAKRLTKNENLGTIALALDMEALDAVEVIAEKTTVEIKLDKKIYNVGKDLTVRGGTVSDVLDNVPSVSVDVEGNVALRGNDNVRILINGKPSGLVGLNSTDALRQLPAESIEKVEVITAPSARYDAEGTAGILNIILRRSKLQGLNGAITVNGGYPTTAGISGNINYRTGDFNFFNTTGYNYREVPGESTTENTYFNREFDETTGAILADNPDSFQNEYREFDRERKGLNTNLGVEWYVNETTSLTTSVFYRDSNNESLATNNTFGLNGVDNSTYGFTRLEDELEDDKTLQYSLNLDKQFNGDSQHRLTFDFQYENSTEDENGLVSQDGESVERVRTLENQDRVLLQTDFTKPIGKHGNFELGYRGNFNELDTDYTLEFFRDGDFQLDNEVSNNLIYKEYVNAIYSQYGNKIKDKFSYLLGLRMESTRITIDQLTSNNFAKKNYTDFFPTVNLGYKFSEDQSLTLGYNRRIRRPRSFFINPFPSRSSPTNVFQGDPDLDPTYSSSFDLGYLNRFGKLTLNASVYYTHSTDVFNFVSESTGDYYSYGLNQIISAEDPNLENLLNDPDANLVEILRRGPINLATNDRYGFEFTLTYRPSRKWNVNGNFNIFQSQTRGEDNGINYDADNVSWFVRLNNKITLPGNIDWQTRLFYRGPSEDAINKRKGIFSTDLAFSKDLFKEKASLAFRISDLFNSRKRMSEATTDTFFSDSEFQWRKRSVNLSFTYRFNQKKQRQRGRNGYGDGDMEMEGQP